MSAQEFDVEGLLRRVEPRPASPALDARVRDAVRRPAGSRAWPRVRWVAAAMLVVAGLGFFTAVTIRGRSAGAPAGARVVTVHGGATNSGRTAAAGDRLRDGDFLQTARGASLEFELPDGSRMRVEEGSGVVVGGPRRSGAVARLVSGAVHCRVARAPEAFRIETERGEVAAVGTEFSARLDRGDGGPSLAITEGGDAAAFGAVLRVAVLEGTVELREPGRVTRVGRRQGLVADGGGPPRVTELTGGSAPEAMPLPGERHLDMSRAVSAVRLSPDGTRIAIAIRNLNGGGLAEYSAPFVGVHVFDLQAGKMTASVRLDGDLSDIAWFGEDSLWATEGMNNEIRRLDLAKGEVAEKRSLSPDPQILRSTNTSRIVASPDRRRAISTGFDHSINVYEMPGWKRLRTLEGPRSGTPTDGTWTADGKRWLAANSAGEVVAWDVESGKRTVLGKGRFPVEGPGGRVWAFTEDLQAFGPLEPGKDEKRDQFGTAGTIFPAAAFSPDGRFLALGLNDGAVEVKEVKTGAAFAKFGHKAPQGATAYVTALEWGKEGSWVAVGRADGSSALLRPEELE